MWTKCHFCNAEFSKPEFILQHYLNSHAVDPDPKPLKEVLENIRKAMPDWSVSWNIVEQEVQCVSNGTYLDDGIIRHLHEIKFGIKHVRPLYDNEDLAVTLEAKS